MKCNLIFHLCNFVIIILLNQSICWGQKTDSINCNTEFINKSYYTARLYSFDAYDEVIPVLAQTVQINKEVEGCHTTFTYFYFNNNAYYDIPDTLKIYVDKCDMRNSYYEYIDLEITDIKIVTIKSILEGKLEFKDSIVTFVGQNNYTLSKYLISTNDSQRITLYYSDTLGIIKQYGSNYNQCQELDGKIGGYEELVINSFLKELYFNLDFHERYDGGPRTIRATVIDKIIVKEKTKKIKKQKSG